MRVVLEDSDVHALEICVENRVPVLNALDFHHMSMLS
jgi:hypothetical protein